MLDATGHCPHMSAPEETVAAMRPFVRGRRRRRMSWRAATEAFYAALLDDDPEQLYERAPCGYLTTTPDGTVVKANATFAALIGYDREDLVGRRSFAELLTAGGRIYHETHFAPLLRMHGTVAEVALDLVRPDGERLPVLVNAVLETDADGSPKLIRIAVFDATHRRAYERELLLAKQRAERSEARAQALARTLQSTLIPPSPPNLPGPGRVRRLPSGRGRRGGRRRLLRRLPDQSGDWVVALGDVCGKGVEAAVVTALVRYSLRALTVQEEQPSAGAARPQRHPARRRAPTGSARSCWSGCGSTPTAGWRRSAPAATRSRCTSSPGGDGAPVGRDRLAGRACCRPSTVHDTVVRLVPGDVLVMYTDGVTEGRPRRRVLRRGTAAPLRARAPRHAPCRPRASSATSSRSRTAPPATTSRWSPYASAPRSHPPPSRTGDPP